MREQEDWLLGQHKKNSIRVMDSIKFMNFERKINGLFYIFVSINEGKKQRQHSKNIVRNITVLLN